MPRRARVFAPGLLYHVIARGNQQQLTFLSDRDYQTYRLLLAKYRQRYGIRLHAYCLMPNHVHLLVETSEPPLAKFMQGLQQSYTQRFNRLHETVGHLFQGRYKAIVCDSDRYLLALIRYIHLNPVRAGLVRHPGAYPYSAHRAYLLGDMTGLIDPTFILSVLGGPAAYQRFVLAGIGGGHEDRYYPREAEQCLGPVEFAQRIGHPGAQPDGSPPRKDLGDAMAELAYRVSLDPATLRGRSRRAPVTRARALVSFVLVRRRGYRVADVAAALGRDANTISGLVWRLAERLPGDPRAALEVSRLAQDV